MQRKQRKKIEENRNIGRKFVMFVKPIDKDGMVLEKECGWLRTNPSIELVFSYKDAMVFEEKENGHGSFLDWKRFFEDEYPNWRINPEPKYLDSI